MKMRLALAALALALVASLGVTSSAAATSKVKATAKAFPLIKAHKDGTATVAAAYICPKGEDWHLWVSAKQAADGSRDPDITQEGGGFGNVPAAWLQSHPTSFKCNGRWQLQTYRIDTAEQGYGKLIRGSAWLQFCLISEQAGLFLIDERWARVL